MYRFVIVRRSSMLFSYLSGETVQMLLCSFECHKDRVLKVEIGCFYRHGRWLSSGSSACSHGNCQAIIQTQVHSQYLITRFNGNEAEEASCKSSTFTPIMLNNVFILSLEIKLSRRTENNSKPRYVFEVLTKLFFPN